MKIPRTERGLFDFITVITTEFLTEQLNIKIKNELHTTTDNQHESSAGSDADCVACQDSTEHNGAKRDR